MNTIRNIINWFKSLLGLNKKLEQVALEGQRLTETGEEQIRRLQEKIEAEKKAAIEKSYRQYRRVMLKQGNTPATFHGWLKHKHPLHHAHFGNFSPLKPI